MTDAASNLLAIKAAQSTFSMLALLQLTSWRFPPDAKINCNEITVDYVVVGGGTAGCIVASRLTEDSNSTVAVIEAGEDPGVDSLLPGLFPNLPLTNLDYNYQAVNDHYTSQHVKGHAPDMTAGKVLGGTSSMSHTLFLRGHPHSYDKWAEAAGDESWNYDGLLEYFKKSERVTEKEILDFETADLHGTNGMMGILRQMNPINDVYIDAYEELGSEFNPDVNSKNVLGVGYPYHLISNGIRQDTANTYLSAAKKRNNLSVYKKTVATKILFGKNNNAIGVEAVTSSGKTIKVMARKEVLLAAGAVKSPQLLMLSGIGPEEHLNMFDIPVRSDLPVGKNLKDRVGLLLTYQMEASDAEPPASNPHEFPTPITVVYRALDPSQEYPDYQALNLLFSHDNPGLLSICSNVIKYENYICNKIYNANKGHNVVLVAISNSHPKSTGEILLRSNNPLQTPLIKVGLFNKESDLDDVGAYLLDNYQLLGTSYFRNSSAKFADLGLWECGFKSKDTLDYWKCYARAMSSTFWQYCGTCSMGSVVDGELKVKGVDRLRVVDASAVPALNSGEILASVIAFAEKAADLIKNDGNIDDQL